MWTVSLLVLISAAIGKPQAVISEEALAEMRANNEDTSGEVLLDQKMRHSRRRPLPRSLSSSDGNNSCE